MIKLDSSKSFISGLGSDRIYGTVMCSVRWKKLKFAMELWVISQLDKERPMRSAGRRCSPATVLTTLISRENLLNSMAPTGISRLNQPI